MATSINYYQSKELKYLNELYNDLLPISRYKGTVIQYLKSCTEILWSAYKKEDPIACIEISNYNKNYLGWGRKQIFAKGLSEDDMLLTIAVEYGYENIETMNDRANINFKKPIEEAVDALIFGDIEKLQYLLNRTSVINENTSFGHNAKLVHYLASNGFEIIRQQVPMNIVAIIDLLNKYPINWNQTMNIYGGKFNALQLADTSIHPYEAGLNKNLHFALRKVIT